jgi:hypothetical protein
MRKLLITIFVLAVASINAFAQEKGVDKQTETIRDAGTRSGPATGGSSVNTGLTSGFNWGKDKTPAKIPVPNPYLITARRETLAQAAQDLIRDKGMVLNEAASKPTEGILITQPYTFAKGAVISRSELSRLANLPPQYNSESWSRGRYTLIIEIQPIDGVRCNVSVTAKIEGKTEGLSGAEWTTLKSSGIAEETFLTDLISRITGEDPSKPKEP